MLSNQVTIDKAGVFLFPAPTLASAQIDRELLVVFAMPVPQATGIVYCEATTSPKDLQELLKTLFDKISKDLGVGDHQIAVKAFGLSHGASGLMAALRSWLERKSLYLAVTDVGRNVGRNLTIDCGSGKIGVRYAESFLPGFPQFLSRGTARQRIPANAPDTEVLILSRNAVCRQLGLQAVEEHRNWTASAPLHPLEMWNGKEYPYFPWSWVIVFQDLEGEEEIVPWLGSIQRKFPNVRFCWVGTRLPPALETMPGLVVLPELVPHRVSEFKTHLWEMFATHAEENPGAGYVIPFPKPRQKKRR